MGYPVAYIRKSKVRAESDPGKKPRKDYTNGLSWEVQEKQVRELATRHGDGEALKIVSDWGSSGAAAKGSFGGTRRGGHRKARDELVQMIEQRQVSALYAYSLSRLARSTKGLLELAEQCAAADVVVRLAKEGDLDFRSAHGRLYLTVLAAVATFEAEVGAERARDHVQLRKDRGDHIGQAPYGFQVVEVRKEVDDRLVDIHLLMDDPAQPIGPVLDAYTRAGSFNGAARILNDGQVPTRALVAARAKHRDDPDWSALGDDGRLAKGFRWSDMTVRRVVARATGGDLTPKAPGRPTDTPALFAKVLRCHCGGPMTPQRSTMRLAGGRTATYTHYTCWRSRHDPDHPRPVKVAETQLLPWIRAEAARFRAPSEVEIERARKRGGATRDELLARRQRVIDNYEDGLVGREERSAKIAAIDGELERIDAAETVSVVVPPVIDWDNVVDVAAVNAFLRAIWDHVELGPDLRPVRAAWGVPPEYVAE